ncbi:HEAT repeat domain-containing protein [Goodfellowiella coeruleoviolacea]|uniref:HEAT repeat domain-containing protein n=1 Tax=Goodfellowiella coeruleoviolacea TaxID=334858 RepID=UPI0020A375B2|nr:HEAT repeat domain-containing protein [Goodfellowiella coeruleoviolacea]
MRLSGGCRSRRFLFDGTDSAAFVAEVARTCGWSRLPPRPRDQTDAGGITLRWDVDRELDPGLRVTYTANPLINASHVMVSYLVGDWTPTTRDGARRRVESTAAVFAAHWSVLTFDALLAAVDTAHDPDTRSLAVLRAGLGAPEDVDQRFVDRIGGCAGSEDDLVREHAVWAMAYAEWAAFRPTLSRMATGDPADRLRDMAAAPLRAFDRSGVPNPETD